MDSELEQVEHALHRLDPTGDRVARVLRDTFDQLYDGQRTSRWSFDQLHKTEKTHMGTLVEINLHREFEFDDGDVTDYRIAGVEVDCKYSMTPGSWSLPPEVIDHLALLITASDIHSSWAAKLQRVKRNDLNRGRNRDAKATLSRVGRLKGTSLWPSHGRLPPNLFLELDEHTRSRIFGARATRGNRHGQARVNELFRLVQRRIIRRAELATVARQDDPMKRARGDGGARTYLQSEGIVVLGHQDKDPSVAASLGLDVPSKGEFISARVVPMVSGAVGRGAEIDGTLWRLALPIDPVITAPIIPRG